MTPRRLFPSLSHLLVGALSHPLVGGQIRRETGPGICTSFSSPRCARPSVVALALALAVVAPRLSIPIRGVVHVRPGSSPRHSARGVENARASPTYARSIVTVVVSVAVRPSSSVTVSSTAYSPGSW